MDLSCIKFMPIKAAIVATIMGISLLYGGDVLSSTGFSGEIDAEFGSWQESEGTITLDITVSNLSSFINGVITLIQHSISDGSVLSEEIIWEGEGVAGFSVNLRPKVKTKRMEKFYFIVTYYFENFPSGLPVIKREKLYVSLEDGEPLGSNNFFSEIDGKRVILEMKRRGLVDPTTISDLDERRKYFLEKAPDLLEKWEYKTGSKGVRRPPEELIDKEKLHRSEIYPYEYYPAHEFYKKNNPSLFPTTENDAPAGHGRSPMTDDKEGTKPDKPKDDQRDVEPGVGGQL